MLTDISSVFLVLVGLAVTVCIVIAFKGKRNIFATSFTSKENVSLQFGQTGSAGYPPPLIDRPTLYLDENATLTIEKEYTEDPKLEIIEDEESALLKAAEVIVEKIQNTVNSLVSTSPDETVVFSRIKSIVSQYRVFDGTSYFDAINSFIAITIERDCNIRFTKEQLHQLWV